MSIVWVLIIVSSNIYEGGVAITKVNTLSRADCVEQAKFINTGVLNHSRSIHTNPTLITKASCVKGIAGS